MNGLMRVGMGYDVHKLTEGRKLILGGVDIPWEKGLLGHSDADVLLVLFDGFNLLVRKVRIAKTIAERIEHRALVVHIRASVADVVVHYVG